MLEPYLPGAFDTLSGFINEHAVQPGYDYRHEFEYGLDLILDAIDRERRA